MIFKSFDCHHSSRLQLGLYFIQLASITSLAQVRMSLQIHGKGHSSFQIARCPDGSVCYYSYYHYGPELQSPCRHNSIFGEQSGDFSVPPSVPLISFDQQSHVPNSHLKVKFLWITYRNTSTIKGPPRSIVKRVQGIC